MEGHICDQDEQCIDGAVKTSVRDFVCVCCVCIHIMYTVQVCMRSQYEFCMLQLQFNTAHRR